MNVVRQVERLWEKHWELKRKVDAIEKNVERLFDLFATINDALSKLELKQK